MKNSNKCPKCESGQIARVEYFGGWSKNIPTGLISGNVKVIRYVCVSCGFSEEWIDSPSDLQKLVKKYGTTSES